MRVQTAGKSHAGRFRDVNQDRFLIKQCYEGSTLLAVADGLGGQPYGEVAADIAIETLAAFEPEREEPAEGLKQLVLKADREIILRSKENPDLAGMGTTLTAAFFDQGVVFWAHVGDSRLYHLSENCLLQITTDHNLAQFLFLEGELAKWELPGHPLRSFLEQFVGSGEIDLESGRFDVRSGDVLLLCTDGLYSEVPRSNIAEMLGANKPLNKRVDSLMKTTLENAGKDNITMVAALME